MRANCNKRIYCTEAVILSVLRLVQPGWSLSQLHSQAEATQVSCSPERPVTEIGSEVRVRAFVQSATQHELRYSWTASAGRIQGNSTQGTWSLKGALSGRYQATVTVNSSGKELAESRGVSYLAHGNLVSAAEFPNAHKVEHWYFIAGVDVTASAEASSIVTLGDSITDGHSATTDGNDRWPDVLANRLQADAGTRKLAVLNHGIGGNRLLLDGLGPNALARFDHDVLAQAGIRYLIVLEGINDIGTLARTVEVTRAEHDALVRHMIAAYEQMITRAHAHDIKVIGATILPFVGSDYYRPGPASEADRQAVNEWIRTPGHFDAVVDLDKLTRDPQHPDRLLPRFDSGDHLHPSPAGYAAMAGAVPLSLFSASRAAQIGITFDDLAAPARCRQARHGSMFASEDPDCTAGRPFAAHLQIARSQPYASHIFW